MFYSFKRVLIFCFELISSCFQLFATFGCSPHHHQEYQQHNNNGKFPSNSQHILSTATVNETRTFSTNKNYLQNHVSETALSNNQNHAHNSSIIKKSQRTAPSDNQKHSKAAIYVEPLRPEIPFHMLVSNYICHGTLFAFGYVNDFLRRIGLLESLDHVEANRPGYTKLYTTFAPFYYRNIILRLINMFQIPICSAPGGYTDFLEREFKPYNSEWKFTGRKIRAINMGSYDYLGHSTNSGSRIESVVHIIKKYGVSVGSSPNELGTSEIYANLECKVARFLGVEDSIVIGMGFATNSLTLPCLFGPGSLVVSDQCNHASLALGCKISGAKIKVFKHNDMKNLEQIIRTAIIDGQPDSGEPWRKIIILIEGIYSMEGTIVDLPEVIRIKKKYKAYLYMDEAHSIGAMGNRGRGIYDYYGCDPREIDILMGTFTKSFAAAGGYIAGDKKIMDYIRYNSAAFYYGSTMSPALCQQISCILDEFLEIDNKSVNHLLEQPIEKRIKQLRRNVVRFRTQLRQLGFHIDGSDDSPVVPMMVYTPTNLKCVIHELLKRGIATTGAAFPVTSLTGPRVRFCLSAAHSDRMIDYTIKCLTEIGTKIGIRYNAPMVQQLSIKSSEFQEKSQIYDVQKEIENLYN
ncbi:hypothetical protein NH340_JMT08610 [Sarcoptes scabiei]|nr:hypothetical protein NH340_JMT08610 [Sarcoptes scabiei]